MGTAVSLFSVITGNMIDSFSSSDNVLADARGNLYYYLGLGGLALLLGMAMYSSWMITG